LQLLVTAVFVSRKKANWYCFDEVKVERGKYSSKPCFAADHYLQLINQLFKPLITSVLISEQLMIAKEQFLHETAWEIGISG
jgi:hypothetical protein